METLVINTKNSKLNCIYVDGHKMTISVFNQIPSIKLRDEIHDSGFFPLWKDNVIGHVNYHSRPCRFYGDHLHLVFTDLSDGSLKKTILEKALWRTAAQGSSNMDSFCKTFSYEFFEDHPQIYIGA